MRTRNDAAASAEVTTRREQDGLYPVPMLTFLSAPTISPNIGPPGEFAWLSLDQLYIDPEYQRHILAGGKANIRTMAEQFSWAKFGCLMVGRRGLTRYAVIDGQHRACAALYRGDVPKVPCLVLQGGQRQEAACFSAINANVTRIHPLQAFFASVTAGEPDSVATVEICRRADVTIVAYPKQDLGPGETQSLTNIRKFIRLCGEEVVVAALTMLRVIDSSAGLPNVAVQGAIMTFSHNPEWIPRAEALGQRLARPMAQLLEKAKQRKQSYGGTEATNFEQVVTLALKIVVQTSSRFYSEADRIRAMGGR